LLQLAVRAAGGGRRGVRRVGDRGATMMVVLLAQQAGQAGKAEQPDPAEVLIVVFLLALSGDGRRLGFRRLLSEGGSAEAVIKATARPRYARACRP
jgi:hypothetical protein